MSFELFIANKLQTISKHGVAKRTTPSLSISVFGMTLAIVIMIVSINVVLGFKKEISNKIYNLDSHIKIKPLYQNLPQSDSVLTDLVHQLPLLNKSEIKNTYVVIEKSAILKTANDFKGVIYKGVDLKFDWEYINKSLIDGRIANFENESEIVVSRYLARQLKLSVGQKVPIYFIENGIKIRNSEIVGIYNTDLIDFDKSYILGNINLLKKLESTPTFNDSYIGIDCNNVDLIDNVADKIDKQINNTGIKYYISSITKSNSSYFTWLELLDMNVVIIIFIMLMVSIFTIISAMLMIVLERTNIIGLLKALGAENSAIRKIFIYLTSKLVLKSLFYGNIIGLGFSLLQQHFQLIKLNAEAYYISYVPIDINWYYVILLNVGIIFITYISLLAPSQVISKIEPNKAIISGKI